MRLKIALSFILLFFSGRLFSQSLNGYVFDEETKKPVANVTVKAGVRVVSTTENGRFNLKDLHIGDTIILSHISYKAYTFIKKNSSIVTVYLKKPTIFLNTVLIRASASYMADSMRLRKEFSSEFNYKEPTLKDIFISKPQNSYSGMQKAPNSFNSLLGINLLQVGALLSKNKSQRSNLQKSLVKDEEYNYVNHVFSKEKILLITSLQGDSLQNFINRYRPSATFIKQMTEYELIQYIRKSYLEFLKSGKALDIINISPLNK